MQCLNKVNFLLQHEQLSWRTWVNIAKLHGVIFRFVTVVLTIFAILRGRCSVSANDQY